MADRDDAMDVGAIEDDALNDDDEENDNGDEVEEGYKMAKVSGCVEINQCVRQFFTKSFLGDDAALMTESSRVRPAPPRHGGGVASMA